jgi:predicted O-methyltransferase YrrM
MDYNKFYTVINDIESNGGLGMRTPTGTARMIYGLAKAMEARVYIDVGTFVGLSCLWVARAMEEIGKDGKIYTVELDSRWYNMAKDFADRAGLAHRIEFILGDSRNVLPNLKIDKADLILLDSGSKGLYHTDLNNLDKFITEDTIILAHDTMRQKYLPFECAEPFRNDICGNNKYNTFHFNNEYGCLLIQKKEGFEK